MFRKCRKLIKKFSILHIGLLMILMNYYIVFGVSINENNGSAFITKAEFDALKNSFQSTIDRYNISIDSKIDTAIASYLSGIKISTENSAVSNIDILSYPLRIINKHNCLENLDNPSDEQTPPVINLAYSLFSQQTNRTGSYVTLMEDDTPSQIIEYLNGNWDSSKNRFFVDSVTINPKYKLGGFAMCDFFVSDITDSVDVQHLYITMMFKTYTHNEVNVAKNANWDDGSTRKLANDFDWTYKLTDNTSDASAINVLLAPIMSNTTDALTSYSSTASLDKVPSGYTGTLRPTRMGGYTTSLSNNSYSYSTSNRLSYLYNYSDDAESTTDGKKKYIVPISYGDKHEVWVTNKKKNRIIIKTASPKTYYYKHRTVYSTCPTGWLGKALGFITAGYNLESIYSTRTTHDKEKMSTARANEIYYKFDDVEKNTIEHKMVDGIPVFSFDKISADKVKDIKVNFNITSQKSSTNKKYVIFSTKPITTYTYDSDVESVTDYIQTKSVNGTAITKRKVELTEGDNEIVLKDLNGGDVLYMKILWDDKTVDNEEMVTINNAPTFVYTCIQ